MEVSGSNGLQYDEEKALKSLLDAFGSVFSLEDIASAYCEAGRKVDLAGEILYERQGSTSSVSTGASNGEVKNDGTSKSAFANNSQTYCLTNGGFSAPKQKRQPVSVARTASNGELKNDESSESSSIHSSQNSCQANGDLRGQKQKWRSVSGGTVSSMLGKEYVKSVPLAKGSHPGTKPLKVDSMELPMSVLWGEGVKPSPLKEDRLHKDMEDFLFKMLGEGFRLERDVIRETLDSCGYDMQKSMEKLLDRSAMNMDKESKFLGESCKKPNTMHPREEGPSPSPVKNRVFNANGTESSGQQKDRKDLQKEVLAALFDGPGRYDELPKSRVSSAKRPIALGELVEGPPTDFTAAKKPDRVHSQVDKKDEEVGEDSFQALRRAVKEYRGTMKEYYKAAIDAFAKGEPDQANRLLEQGEFFRGKARQADEESNLKIFETSTTETEDVMLLELHDHGAKEAIRLLKCHLSSLAGIPSFKYLKVIVEKNEEESSKGTRKRLVMKLLEKESISWSEGETPRVVMIRLDKINPKLLSFAKK